MLEAGPRVATILARRVRSMAAKGIMFGLGFERSVFMSRMPGYFLTDRDLRTVLTM